MKYTEQAVLWLMMISEMYIINKKQIEAYGACSWHHLAHVML